MAGIGSIYATLLEYYNVTYLMVSFNLYKCLCVLPDIHPELYTFSQFMLSLPSLFISALVAEKHISVYTGI